MESLKNEISIEVHLDEARWPEKLMWKAEGAGNEERQPAKAMMLSLWDGADKSALRIDLWVKDMMTDEMADFYYQTLMGMADTLVRSTGDTEEARKMKEYAGAFLRRFKASLVEKNKSI